MVQLEEEVFLEGIPLSEGIAIGLLCFLKPNEKLSIPEFTITTSQVPKEIARYREALLLSRSELQRLQFYLAREGSREAVGILAAQILMLDDPTITSEVEEEIGRQLRNTESVFKAKMDAYLRLFNGGSGCPVDVQDLSTRILRNLYPQSHVSTTIPLQSVVSAYELVPSQTAEASINHIRAFVTEIGGETSHAGLIAKAQRIPYISHIKVEHLIKHDRSKVIVDGYEGWVIVNPSEETLRKYQGEKHPTEKHYVGQEMAKETRTLDGTLIDVQANLESLHDLYLLKEYNVSSIGLLRSEFLYLKKGIEEFGETEQFDLYKKLMQMAGNMEIGFRFFDIGNDKRFFPASTIEPNPALGCRSIRLLMKNPSIFSTQIRAILRASLYGKVKFLLPLVSDLIEFREAKSFILEEREKMIREGIKVPSEISIGCMVEVPAFVIMCDQMIEECDFLSIGTNDLVQYSLVADRSNPETCDRYGPTHPSILRMIKMVVNEGKRVQKPVSICGHIASDVSHIELLIGLGLRIFSSSPRDIPFIKKAISTIDIQKAEEKAKKALCH